MIDGAIVRKLSVVIVLEVLSPGIASEARAADITYAFVNYPADQISTYGLQQYSLSGSVTTDGAIGPLNEQTDILSWQFSFSSGTFVAGPFSGNGSDIPVGDLVGGGAGGLNASAGALTLSGSGSCLFCYPTPSSFSAILQYDPGDVSEGMPLYSCVYYPNWSPGALNDYNWGWDSERVGKDANVTPTMNGSFPWVIAQVSPVPEPSTVLLLVSAVACLSVFRRRLFKR